MKYTDTREWKRYIEIMNSRPYLFNKSNELEIIVDDDTVNKFVENKEIKVGVLYESKYHILLVDLVRNIKGETFVYERLIPQVESNGVVAVVRHSDKFVLIKKFRHSIREYLYEFLRGFGEKGLSSKENMTKELKEEIGINNSDITLLGEIYADSGVLGNKIEVFLSETNDNFRLTHEEEIVDIIEVSEAEIFRMIENGEIKDGITIAAYDLWTHNKR